MKLTPPPSARPLSTPPPPSRNAVPRLQAELTRRATEEARRARALVPEEGVPVRGVGDEQILEALHAWWKAERIGALAFAEQRRIVLSLFAEAALEDQLAGVMALEEMLAARLGPSDASRIQALLDGGEIKSEVVREALLRRVLAPLQSGAAAVAVSPAPGGSASPPAGRRRARAARRSRSRG